MFLAAEGERYTRNTLKGMRAALSVLLRWAVDCKTFGLDSNPCLNANGEGIPLPKGTENTITRNVLTPEQTKAIAAKLEEPYATLILFLGVTGLRICEAAGVQWGDLDGNILNVSRRIYGGIEDVELKTKKSKRKLPIPSPLLKRLKKLPRNGKWIFSTRAGTPIDDGNALGRYVQPAAKELGIQLSGFHDFRHTLATKLKESVDPKTAADMLGQSVKTYLEIYVHSATDDFRGPLNRITDRLM